MGLALSAFFRPLEWALWHPKGDMKFISRFSKFSRMVIPSVMRLSFTKPIKDITISLETVSHICEQDSMHHNPGSWNHTC
jgi:hypothetical protein